MTHIDAVLSQHQFILTFVIPYNDNYLEKYNYVHA